MSRTAFEHIKASGKLPTPTGVALRILELTQVDTTTVDEIAAAVERDPAITSRLLKLVNSPLAGLPRQVASATRAVTMLGARTVASLALGFSLISEHRDGRCSAFDYDLFWSDAVARAVVSRHVANQVGNFAPDEAFTCGLLCQIGRLALAHAFPKRYASALESPHSADPEGLLEIEQELFEIGHTELAAEMMDDWHLPALFRAAVSAQLAPDAGQLPPGSRQHSLARILHFAGSIACVLTRPTAFRDTLSKVLLEANQLGIAPDVFHDFFDAVNREWHDAGAILAVRTRRVPPLTEIYAQARSQSGIQSGEPRESVSM